MKARARRVLLLSPALSADQVLEGVIIKTYVKQACAIVLGEVDVVASWEQPAMMLAMSALSGTLLGSDDLGRQTVVLSIASAACLAAELEASCLLVVCLNGPVPNPGFCAFAVLAASANRPVVYWKDDVRKLWGIEDDPLTLGLLPGASSRLMLQGPKKSLSQLSHLSVNMRNSFHELVEEAIRQNRGDPTPLPGSYVHSLVQIGNSLREATTYDQIRGIVDDHRALLDVGDQRFLGSKN
jgi:hypothetical protein